MNKRQLFIICGLWLMSGVALAQLPGESVLPGRRQLPTGLAGGGKLPSESVLPGQRQLPTRLPGEQQIPGSIHPTDPTPPDPVDPTSVGNLPSESALPVAHRPPPPPEQIGALPAGQPWLRLNLGGHSGLVRSLAFDRQSQHLYSGGEDKSIESWVLGAADPNGWRHEKTIRWRIQRGARGRISALAAGPDMIAVGGHGAEGLVGEILLVDPATGSLKTVLGKTGVGHRQVIQSLSFAPRAAVLASMDVHGKAMVWQPDAATGIWSGSVLAAGDDELENRQMAHWLAPWRVFSRVTMAGDEHVIYPVVSRAPDGQRPPTWNLARVNLRTRATSVLRAEHVGGVTALAASADGRRLVSSDLRDESMLLFWQLDASRPVGQQRTRAPVLSMAMNADGSLLIIGMARTQTQRAALEVWDTSNLSSPRVVFRGAVEQDVTDCRFTPDGTRFAYTQGHRVLICEVARPNAPQSLSPKIRSVKNVAFARRHPTSRYTIAFGREGEQLTETFDPAQLQLGRDVRLQSGEWIPRKWWAGNPWSIRIEDNQGRRRYWLYENNARRGQLGLRLEFHGDPISSCWIPGPDGRAVAVAVGTARRNNLYVFRIADSGVCPIVRVFRGDTDVANSIGVSSDLRYLVSGCDDGTVSFWKLQAALDTAPLGNRWGAEFEVENNRLIATRVGEDGPLHFRGVRDGDVIEQLDWVENQATRNAREPARMMTALQNVDWDALVAFQFSRNGQQQEAFQMLPAWQPVATLFVTDEREWAYWTPSGYYDASFNGHKLFGWQINRSLAEMPEFFLAAQFRAELEQPKVMEQLLDAGSLGEAFRRSRQRQPAAGQQAIVEQYRAKPRVEILEPAADQVVADGQVRITARVTVRSGETLVPPKAFANGVVAPGGQIVERLTVPGGTSYLYRWDAQVPSDRRLAIQVIASTESEAVELQTVLVDQPTVVPGRRSRMYVAAAGINQYRDASIGGLDYAVNNASTFVDRLRTSASGLYGVEALSLLGNRVTRPMWNVSMEQFAERLEREATPDDVLVVFLSGHGVRDESTGRYYYLGADARVSDVRSGRYADCLSFEDFAAFAEVPCRKLVILDTCHSGAVQQPLRQQDLKAALRALQDDLVFTVTASEGDEEAIESRQQRLGRFTSRLVQALDGAADRETGNRDGIVSLNEAIAFVKQRVVEDSSADAGGKLQTPTAGPIDLLPLVDLPLSRAPSTVGFVPRRP